MDSRDVRIFREFVQDRGIYPLQSDVRQSFRNVATRLNLDVATVRDRVKKLQESGFIKGWHVFPNPSLFNLGVAHAKVDMPINSTIKEDVLRKVRLVQGVWMIVNHFSTSMRVVLYFEDEESLRRQIELISRISSSENILHREIHFPPCAVTLSQDDLELVNCIQTNPTKPYNAISKETGLSNKTVKKRLERMLAGRALFMIPSLNPRSLNGAMLAELLVLYGSQEAMTKENGRIASQIDGHLLSAQLGDPEHMLFLLVIRNISEVKEILNWVKQQPGVKRADLDLVEERFEQYETFNRQVKRKLALTRENK